MTDPTGSGPAAAAPHGEADDGQAPDGSRRGAGPDPNDPNAKEEIPLPIGTLFFMMLYIVLIAGMWGAIYFEFLGR